MKIPRGKQRRGKRTTKSQSQADRSHRVKIDGELDLEELSQALQMALARMEDKGHGRVRYVSLYYRPVDPTERKQDPHTIEIRLPPDPTRGM